MMHSGGRSSFPPSYDQSADRPNDRMSAEKSTSDLSGSRLKDAGLYYLCFGLALTLIVLSVLWNEHLGLPTPKPTRWPRIVEADRSCCRWASRTSASVRAW